MLIEDMAAVKKMTKRLLSAAFATMMIFAVQVATAQAAIADVTLKDIQTIVRAVGFLETAPDSASVMAIVYNPADSDSLQDAQQMEALVKKEKKDIKPRLVSVSDLAGLRKADFAFVTGGLREAHHSAVKAALNQNKVLSFTTDRACINGNCCAVYVNSKGRVEIIVNKQVADAIEARFKPVFLMMVTVI